MPRQTGHTTQLTVQHALQAINPLPNALSIPQDLAQAINMQKSAPQRQLAEQTAYGRARGLTDMAGQQHDPQQQLALLRRAQDIYTQQGQYAQQNAQGFSQNIGQSPLERGGKSAAEIVSAAMLANLAATGAHAFGGVAAPGGKAATGDAINLGAQQVADQTAPGGKAATGDAINLGAQQVADQTAPGASPLSAADAALRLHNYPEVYKITTEILQHPELKDLHSSASQLLQIAMNEATRHPMGVLQAGATYGR